MEPFIKNMICIIFTKLPMYHEPWHAAHYCDHKKYPNAKIKKFNMAPIRKIKTSDLKYAIAKL